MNEIIDKNKCTGCSACKNICPKHAIKMKCDETGFKYPIIDENKCIDCGLCVKTCPVLNTKENISLNDCYVGYAIESYNRINSSSGGIFPLIANYFLDNNGIVIGSSFDENNKLKHIAIDSKDDLERLKGSKYLPSDLNDLLEFIKNNVNDKKILFVGTPCQVAGLKAFMQDDHNNLFCLDLICHGVPAPKLFEKNINELESKYGKLITYNFRDKSAGWETYSTSIKFKNNAIIEKARKNNYMKLYLSNIALRESCYNCNFKLGNKYSDITLGDFWGVKNYYPEMYNKDGTSAIIINTKKGIALFNIIKNKIKYRTCNIEEIIEGNLCLVKSVDKPKNTKDFFIDIDKMSFVNLTKKYQKKTTFFNRALLRIKNIKKK